MKKTLITLAMLFCFAAQSWAALSGTVTQSSFTGPITGKTIPYAIYTPPGYSGGSESYPVIYHLHGINGTYNGNQINTYPAELEQAVANGWIAPCIMVFPDGYTDSFWADSYDGVKPAETNLVYELIPYIDANYRTLASREYRVIEGYSMGGFGASKFAAKFPDLFCCCMFYDGALLQWDLPGTTDDIVGKHPTQAANIFNNDEDYFNQYSPWYQVDQNAATLQSTMRWRQVRGTLSYGTVFHNYLDSYSIYNEFVQSGCSPHTNQQCMVDYDAQNTWTFISSSMGGGGGDTTPPGPITGFTATPGDQQIQLNWSNPGDADLAGIRIQRSTAGYPAGPNDGMNVYNQLGTSFLNTGLTNGTMYYYSAFAYDEVPNYASGSGVAATPQSSQQSTFNSVGGEDGWVQESTETSGVGGSLQSAWAGTSGLIIGDTNLDRQYKAVVSFDTSSLPDGATILSATVRIKRGTLSGTSPFTTHGTCYADVNSGGFNGNTALESADFQAAATASQAATLSNAPANGDWSEGTLNSAGRSAVNKTGKTQIRVYFSLDDNDDSGNDYLGYYPGENATQANRPQLIVNYQ